MPVIIVASVKHSCHINIRLYECEMKIAGCNDILVLVKGYHTAVFISALTLSLSVHISLRQSRGLIST